MLDRLVQRAEGFSRALLEETRDRLQDVGRHRVQHAVQVESAYHVAAVAVDRRACVEKGDNVCAGLYLEHEPAGHTEMSARIFRVVCGNGMLVEVGRDRRLAFDSMTPPPEWRTRIAETVTASFSPAVLEEEVERLQRSRTRFLSTAYEQVIHLVRERLIDEDERSRIQREYDLSVDPTLYGLVNAITRVAQMHRHEGRWHRALELERLGGEVARGMHEAAGSPVLA